jgi:uncharacterized protein YbaP (TraB family)
MLKRCLFCFLILASFSVRAQQALLWEVLAPGEEKPSYLFGTIHLREERMFAWNDSFYVALESCEAIAGEIIIDKKAIKGMASQFLLPNGTKLNNYTTAAEYDSIMLIAKEYLGIYKIIVPRILPVMTNTLIVEKLTKAERKEPVDMYLQDWGKENDKKILGLETMESQISLLFSDSIPKQVDDLMETVRNIEEVKKGLNDMIALYLAQDLDGLSILINDTTQMSADELDALLNKRNIGMHDSMMVIMQRYPTFFAVGAAHLPGEVGLLYLLEKSGCRLRPVGLVFESDNGKKARKRSKARLRAKSSSR